MATATLPPPAAQPKPLPTPSERPGADVVIFDGDCGICTAQVRKLPWWDCRKRLSYLSLHDPEVYRRWPDLSHDRLMQEMLIVDREGNRRTSYSLRHTYICIRLMEGADIYQIAKNCRTSVEMIEKFYAAHLKTTLDASAINVRKPKPHRETQSTEAIADKLAKAQERKKPAQEARP